MSHDRAQPDNDVGGIRFVHQPLDSTRQEIRLLRFRRKSKDSNIECQLHHVILKKAHLRDWGYTALSYTWGDASLEHPLRINNAIYHIGSHLYRFCQRYRRSRQFSGWKWTNWLWIDQICIDQSSDDERNHQVKLMSRIYGYADNTLVWLTDNSSSTGRVVTTDGPLGAAFSHFSALHSLDSRALRTSLVTKAALDEAVECMRLFLRHPYFRRLWIVQEVLLALKVVILVEGGSWMSWSQFYLVYDRLRSLSGYPELSSLEIAAESLLDLRASRGNLDPSGDQITHLRFEYMDLLDCLEQFSKHECRDPRDKIFGIMSLVYGEQRIEVDYAKSIQEVLLDVLRVALKPELPRTGRITLTELGFQVGLAQPEHRSWSEFVRSIYTEDKAWSEHDRNGLDHVWSKKKISAMSYEESDVGTVSCWWYKVCDEVCKFESLC